MIEFLKKVPLLADLEQSDLERLEKGIEIVRLRAGKQLFAEGSLGDRAYIIRDGEIDIYISSTSGELTLATRQAGEVFGELALLGGSPRIAGARARSDAVLLAISIAQLNDIFDASPLAARLVMRTLAIRWSETEAEYRRVEQIQAILYRIAAAASAVEDMSEFYASMHRIVGELMEARNFFIALYDDARQMINWPYFVDERDPNIPDPRRWDKIGMGEAKGLTVYVLRTGQPMLVTR
jgi:CRP-like cAMP-binding protein